MRSQNPTPDALKRITSDLKEAMRAKNSMFVVQPHRKDITHIEVVATREVAQLNHVRTLTVFLPDPFAGSAAGAR
jgi:hypothetical protein